MRVPKIVTAGLPGASVCPPATYCDVLIIGSENPISYLECWPLARAENASGFSDDSCTRGRAKRYFSTLYFDWRCSWRGRLACYHMLRSSVLGDLLRAHGDWHDSGNNGTASL